MAEVEGFEPPVPAKGTTVFETATFDHSVTPPYNNLSLFKVIKSTILANFRLIIKYFLTQPQKAR